MNKKNLTSSVSKFLVTTFFVFQLILIPKSTKVYAFSSGSGTSSDPYLISTAAELDEVRNNMDKCFRQIADIDLSGYSNWNPIGDYGNHFDGNYDGDGHKILNLNINKASSDAVGLFGYAGPSAGFENLGIENANIIGENYVGTLVGQFYGGGNVINCYSTGNVEGKDIVGNLIGMSATLVNNCYSTGTVTGHDYLGGLVGQNYGGIISQSYSTGTVVGNDNIGGIAGQNFGGIVRQSYSVTAVKGNTFTGGVVGISSDDNNVQSCYYNSEESGQNDTGKGTAISTMDMEHESSFQGFTFSGTAWKIDEGNSFPQLYWEAPFRDVQAPIAVAFTPQKNDNNTSLDTSFSIDFNKNIYKGVGNITLKKADGTSAWPIDVRSSNVTITGNRVNISFSPAVLQYDTQYKIYADRTCFKNSAGICFDGINDSDSWSFKTIKESLPPPAGTNHSPVLGNKNFQTNYETTLTGNAAGTDEDNDTLTYSISQNCNHGSVAISTDGAWTYTPAAGYSGNDDFVIKVNDGHGGTGEGTISILVEAPVITPPTQTNHNPVLGDSSFQTSYETTLTGNAVGTDADNDTLTYVISRNCNHGIVNISTDGAWTYTPAAGYSGNDDFIIEVSDGHGGTAEGTISILVEAPVIQPPPPPSDPINHNPSLDNYSFETDYETAVSGKAIGSDIDNDPLTYTVIRNSNHGSVVMTEDGEWTYIPVAGFSGKDDFIVKVSDGRGGEAQATISILVKDKPKPPPKVNHAPNISDYSYKINYGTKINGKIQGTDEDNDELTYFLYSNCTHGKLTVNQNGEWSYEPLSSYSGKDYFKIEVGDGNGGYAIAKVTIIVKPKNKTNIKPNPVTNINNAPTVLDYWIVTKYETPVSGKIIGKDKDGDTLVYKKYRNSQHGKISVESDGGWTYVPDKLFEGIDNFQIAIFDGKGGKTFSAIHIKVKKNRIVVEKAAGAQKSDGSHGKVTHKKTAVSADKHKTDKNKNPLVKHKNKRNTNKVRKNTNIDGKNEFFALKLIIILILCAVIGTIIIYINGKRKKKNSK